MLLAFILVGAIVLFVAVLRGLRRFGFALEAYRPELHYMRGPGPKCREKHLAASRGRS
jgi:hypothetical protein